MDRSLDLREWALIMLAAAMFASSFFFNKVAVETIPPLTIAAGRVALGIPVVLLLLRLRGIRLPPLGRRWLPFMGLGILTAAIPYTVVAWGQIHIESALAGILFGTIPLFTVLFAHFLTRDERFTTARGFGVAVGLVGVVLIVGPAALGGVGGHVLGEALTLIAAVSYALGAIYARRFPDLPPLTLAAGQVICAAAVVLPASLVLDAPWTLAPPAEAVWAVVAVAVISTSLPAILMFWLIQRVGATNTSLTAFFMPIVAVVLGAALLGEWLPWTALGGLALILLGAVLVGGRFRLLAGRVRS